MSELMNKPLKQMDVALFPHQKRCVAWLLDMEEKETHGGMLCDQMGQVICKLL